MLEEGKEFGSKYSQLFFAKICHHPLHWQPKSFAQREIKGSQRIKEFKIEEKEEKEKVKRYR